MRFILANVCFVLALAVVRLGWTENSARANTPAALERASRNEGGWNAARLEDLAEVSAAAGDRGRASVLLRQAVTADPRHVSAWLALGLRAENAGDLVEAETVLNQAARLDRQYLPAWTLANFYFRRSNPHAFWPWAQRAAHMTYDDFRPLFRLCDVFEPNAGTVIHRLGGERNMLRAYVTYLAGESRRLDAAEEAASRLLLFHNQRDWPVFVNLITREITANRMPPALALWNSIFVPLDPRQGPVLTNGDLKSEPTGEAFDWTMPPCAGVVSEWQPLRVAFNLSGTQPDDCILLDQPIPLASRRRYSLRFEERSETATSTVNAVHWEAAGYSVATPAAGDSWHSGEGVFRASADGLAHLRLVYRRAPGTLAFEGRIEIRNVRMGVQ